MINNPSLISELIGKIENLSFQELDQAIKKVDEDYYYLKIKFSYKSSNEYQLFDLHTKKTSLGILNIFNKKQITKTYKNIPMEEAA